MVGSCVVFICVAVDFCRTQGCGQGFKTSFSLDEKLLVKKGTVYLLELCYLSYQIYLIYKDSDLGMKVKGIHLSTFNCYRFVIVDMMLDGNVRFNSIKRD